MLNDPHMVGHWDLLFYILCNMFVPHHSPSRKLTDENPMVVPIRNKRIFCHGELPILIVTILVEALG
jgi:hypothetical protein